MIMSGMMEKNRSLTIRVGPDWCWKQALPEVSQYTTLLILSSLLVDRGTELRECSKSHM